MDIRPILSTLRRHKTAAALIVLEIALACAIVCNALFLIGNRIETLQRPSGIAESQLVTVALGGIGQQVNAAARTREDLAALRAVPGVRNATVLNQVPFVHYSWNTSLALTPDQERPTLNAAQYMAEEGTLQTLGLQLVAGRDFTPDEYLDLEIAQTDRDAQKKGTAIILNRATAEKMFPGQNALGKTLYTGAIPVRVVGIVDTLARPTATSGLAEIDYAMLLPLRLNYTKGLYVLRVTDPARRQEVLTAATAALMKVDNSRLVLKQQTYAEIRDDYFQGDRAMVWLLGAVCIALLIVTALGIVGLASFWVQQRTKQIGIRRALGATRGQILRYFQTENFLLASTGIVLGMLLAYAINQWLMGKYELPRLPLYYLPFGALTLWLLGQIAVFAPARRAAAVPPAVATRSA
ncbi:ABC transporter permease [Xanthomonas graminis]|jgi:putative ABC transport system permease protein|uniref:ABC transporter, permease protein n=1 Tax=Xanthomonas graminis pv. graminis TaxID=134874 RepID=A0A1M4IPS0_9XANT|nr:FtsX-like permease family protein [Xanthomonas translucens]EKU23782.1 putative permease [Xanthomonas translucens pv. graminis ART-Xtg29]OAX60594.1 ABC transporter permease [Xanthomonas translucens pv. graminis]UKE54182.1 ABC transporter permease [Xanthomonas translucens pv. graminis]WIH12086.1 ABC transporter permease [Xanthomonas translucens pv. graminis]WIH15760.1 ABC transporter permease [Xanthomonas translucens pv. graminis]